MEVQARTAQSSAYRTSAAGSTIALHSHAHSSLTIVPGDSYEEVIGGRAGMEAPGSALVRPAGLSHAQQFDARGARKIIITPAGALSDALTGTTPFQAAPAARFIVIRRPAVRIDAERRTADCASRGAIEGLIWQASATLGRDLAGALAATACPGPTISCAIWTTD